MVSREPKHFGADCSAWTTSPACIAASARPIRCRPEPRMRQTGAIETAKPLSCRNVCDGYSPSSDKDLWVKIRTRWGHDGVWATRVNLYAHWYKTAIFAARSLDVTLLNGRI